MKPEIFRVTNTLDSDPDKHPAWDCCGDYQIVHIQCFHDAIVKRYGAATVSEIHQDDVNGWWFEYTAHVNWQDIKNDIGITDSGPSSSSSSVTPPQIRSGYKSTKWWARFQK